MTTTRKPRLALFYILLSSAVQCSAFLSPRQTPRQPLPKSLRSRRGESSLAAWDGRGFEELKRRIGAAFLSAAIVASPLSLAIQGGDSVSIDRPSAQALTDEQVLVVDVWREVNRQFVDGDFAGLGKDGWKDQQKAAVKQLTSGDMGDMEKTYKVIRTMLSSLKDPYTRFLTPDQYDTLASVARGGSAGIGVQLQVDPNIGECVVMSTVANGPAQIGGVLPGDAVLEVDGQAMTGQPAELVARFMRGDAGTDVNVLVRHLGKVDANGKAGKGATARMTLKRAVVKVSPVEATQITLKSSKSGGGNGVGGDVKVGLITVPSFSQETVGQLVDALRTVKPGSDALAIDLRGNAGGYMPAGVDAAKLFLPQGAKVISEISRDESAVQVFMAEGVGAETQLPLYLLVDSRTASASEIMAVALQDNHRATLVGGSAKTFGKGRIQNVQQLSDGSGIAVTKAKYLSPTGRDIHGVGITPDTVNVAGCAPASPAEACLAGVL